MEKKKTIILTIIGVITLLIAVIGATYAYFAVQATNNFGTFTGTATTPTLGTVTLTSGSPFELNVSRSDMMDENKGTYYYAVGDNGNAGTIATASVTGDGTFLCSYTLTGTLSGSMMEVIEEYDANLYINGREYDVALNETLTINGNIAVKSGINNTIKGNIAIINNYVNQNHLIDKTLTFTANVSEFKCTAVEDVKGIPFIINNPDWDELIILGAENGMTWENWVNSGYAPGDVIISDGNIVFVVDDYFLYLHRNEYMGRDELGEIWEYPPVLPTDIIDFSFYDYYLTI